MRGSVFCVCENKLMLPVIFAKTSELGRSAMQVVPTEVDTVQTEGNKQVDARTIEG